MFHIKRRIATTAGKNNLDKWLRVDLSAAPELADAVSNFVTEIGAAGVCQGTFATSSPESEELNQPESLTAYLPWDKKEESLAALKIYLDGLNHIFPDLKKTTFTIEEINATAWEEEWKKFFHPLRIGKRLIIKPTWEPYQAAAGDIVIEIDPGMAFGTGQHHSTSMCLETMEDLFSRNDMPHREVLDVGTGTGILGIAAAKLGAERVLCLDIDEKAVEIACGNALLNQVEKRLEIRNREISSLRRPFNLILANLTAKALIALKVDLERLLLPQGYLIISGIIEQNSREIEDCFSRSPLCLFRKLQKEEWLCYAFHRE